MHQKDPVPKVQKCKKGGFFIMSNWFNKTVEEVEKELNTNLEKGLTRK